MSNTIYSIVDIETTGGKANQHKMTEIAIIKFDGEKIIDEFQTLINPERNIPYFISQLTGITNEMVEDAPRFYEVAKQIVKFTEGTVFVAHNVYFDYNIIKREFAELGYRFQLPKLCTVKLGRKFIPGHKSYSLGKICEDLGIELKDRHRAYGDAAATVELFKLILRNQQNSDEELTIEKSQQISLPAGLTYQDIQDIPETIGVYFLLNEQGHIIYIGKSKNIQKRIKTHLSTKLKKTKDLQIKGSIAEIDYIEIPHEWVSLILEADLIKKHRPPYNRALNRKNFKYGLRTLTEEGRLKLRVTTRELEVENTAFMYRSKKTAFAALNRFYQAAFGCEFESLEHEKYCQLIPVEDYNKQLQKVISNREYPSSDFILTLPVNKKDSIKLNFEDNELRKIIWQKKSFLIEEDPDIKRLILKKLYLYKEYMSDSSSDFEEELWIS